MRTDTEDYIRRRKRNARSIDDQVTIAHAMWEHGIGPDHEGLKADDVADELGVTLGFAVRTSLRHLGEAGIVEEFLPPGPETLVIAEWRDGGDGEVVNGEVGEAAEEALDALADELEARSAGTGATTAADGSGATLRAVVSEALDVVPDHVEDYLRTTDEPVDVLIDAVGAIEDASGVSIPSGCGELAFINMPYRYRLTPKAVRLYER